MASWKIPPGLIFLSSGLSRALASASTAYAATVLIRILFDLQMPLWLPMSIFVLSLPALLWISVFRKDSRIKRQAKALGAVLPPRITGKLPGSIDILWEGAKIRHTMYPGDKLDTMLSENNNTIAHRILFEDRIITSEPEYIKNILATNFDNFEKGETFTGLMAPLLGTGVFNSDGERWRFHRSMTRPFFSQERIRHFQIFDRHAKDTISQLKSRLKDGYAVDIQDAMSRFTLDCVTEFLFGIDVCSLSAGLNYPPEQAPAASSTSAQHPSNLFANSFIAAQEAVGRRIGYGHAWPIIEFWEDLVAKSMGVIRAFVDPIVENALKQSGEKLEGDEQRDEDGTLLEHLIKLTDDPDMIKDEILNIMLAGRDTTAATLTFVVGMLAQHQDVLFRLREEVFKHIGTRNTPTYDDLRDMKYLRAVINETLRLYPPVPFNIRFSIKETVWPSLTGDPPLYIPERTMCVYSVFLMHRRKDLWGPDALEFDPDRFLDYRVKKYLTPNPMIFLPFNAGPRMCLGQLFAYNEVSLMIIRLLQSFSEISLAPEASPASRPPASWADGPGRRPNEKIWLKTHLTLHANKGCWVRMKEAVAEKSDEI